MNELAYKQGDMVKWSVPGVLQGRGRIVGVASIGAAVIGVSYIVEDLSEMLPTEVYPFTHLCVFECNLEKIVVQ